MGRQSASVVWREVRMDFPVGFSLPDEDCGSVLPDVAEWAKEVIPLEHRWRVVQHVRLTHAARLWLEDPIE